MASAYIREYNKIALDYRSRPVQAGVEDGNAVGQVVTFTTATQSSAFANATRFVRFISDADCHLEFGASPTATTSSGLLCKADVAEYFAVVPGQKVSVYDGTS